MFHFHKDVVQGSLIKSRREKRRNQNYRIRIKGARASQVTCHSRSFSDASSSVSKTTWVRDNRPAACAHEWNRSAES